MSTSRYAVEYNMFHKYRGYALIFNHEIFNNPGLSPRKGTYADCKRLEETFKALKFDVRVYNDLSLADLKHQVDKGKRYLMSY